jgi:ATP-binding cassette, subfamily B, bacterial
VQDLVKLIRYSWSLKRYYLAITVLVVVGSALYQATPFALKYIVNDLVQGISHHQVSTSSLWTWLLVILAANFIGAVVNNWQGYFGDMLAAKLNTLLSQSYYDHLLELPLAYFDGEVAGRITSRLDRSINTVTNFFQGMANNFIGNFLIAIITIVVLAVYAWPIAIALFLLFPFYAFLTRKSSARWQAKQMGINADTDANVGRFVESINHIRVVKSFAREFAERSFFAGKRSSIEIQTRSQSIQWHQFDVMRRSGLAVIFFFIYSYVVIETYHGKYSLGQMTLMLQLVNQAQFPLWGLSYVVDQLQRARAGSRDFFEVMETEPSITDRPSAAALTVPHGRIEFSHLKFAYDNGQQVLDDLSFTIEPGTRVALVGESGEGKTTISNLLLRFYSLDSGEISIDGADIAGVTQSSLREQIGVVFQEPALFSGSIRENIAYSRPDATDDEIAEAARIANAAGFIEHFKDGYDTEIGERGVRLSGGQKQRIAIARAVLKNPPILIFDEATSSLDSRAEAEVQQALDRLMEGRSTLVIAHRLSTIAGVDKIVGIRGGRVVEQGAPAELARAGGMYADLLTLQDPTKDNLAVLRRYDLASDDDENEVESEPVA